MGRLEQARSVRGDDMRLTLTPVRVAISGDDLESFLVFDQGYLVAVLVQLSAIYGEDAGQWFLEAAFGRLHYSKPPPTFADLDVARAWILAQLADV